MSKAKRLSICKCPKHDVLSISIDDDDGGIRLTGTKCCGRWDVVRAWPIDKRMRDDIVTELEELDFDE